MQPDPERGAAPGTNRGGRKSHQGSDDGTIVDEPARTARLRLDAAAEWLAAGIGRPELVDLSSSAVTVHLLALVDRARHELAVAS